MAVAVQLLNRLPPVDKTAGAATGRGNARMWRAASRPLGKETSVGSLLIAPQKSAKAADGPIQCSERCVG